MKNNDNNYCFHIQTTGHKVFPHGEKKTGLTLHLLKKLTK